MRLCTWDTVLWAVGKEAPGAWAFVRGLPRPPGCYVDGGSLTPSRGLGRAEQLGAVLAGARGPGSLVCESIPSSFP